MAALLKLREVRLPNLSSPGNPYLLSSPHDYHARADETRGFLIFPVSGPPDADQIPRIGFIVSTGLSSACVNSTANPLASVDLDEGWSRRPAHLTRPKKRGILGEAQLVAARIGAELSVKGRGLSQDPLGRAVP